jgi:hypothetical protein
VLPRYLKIFSGCHLFWRVGIVHGTMIFPARIIIELNWSLEADTLPQWSRSADPVLDRSKVRDESRMPEKLHDRAKMNRLHILGSDILR